MLWFGSGFIICAGLMLALKVDVARSSDGGAPVLDGVIFPPLFATFGFSFLGLAERAGTGDWIYFVVWLAMTLFAFGAISYAAKVGERDNE